MKRIKYLDKMTQTEVDIVRIDYFQLNQSNFISKYNTTTYKQARDLFGSKKKILIEYSERQKQIKARQDQVREDLKKSVTQKNEILKERFGLTDKQIQNLTVKQGWGYSELFAGRIINGIFHPKNLIKIIP